MRSSVINFSSVWTPSLLLDTLGKKSQAWKQGGKRSLKRKACLNSQQGGSLVISYMMLSSLVKKSHGSRRKHVLQKSQWQAESSWFQCQPSLSITTKTWSTSHSVHKEQPTLIAAQVLTAAGAGGMSPVFQISLQDIVSCGRWYLRKRKPFPESLQVITVTVASIFKSRKKCRSLLPQPQQVWAHAGVVTGMPIFPGTSFFGPDSPLFWLSLSVTTWGCCYCVSLS